LPITSHPTIDQNTIINEYPNSLNDMFGIENTNSFTFKRMCILERKNTSVIAELTTNINLPKKSIFVSNKM